MAEGLPWLSPIHKNEWDVCVYYCRTYYKAVRGGGGGEDLVLSA